MNIMIFADQESKLLYEYYDPEQMKDIDLIISCGDLEPEYLTFFATLCHAPLLYVKGNHDTKYEYKPPEGCIFTGAHCGTRAAGVEAGAGIILSDSSACRHR